MQDTAINSAMFDFTEEILERLAGTVDPDDSLILAANIHDAFAYGLSVDEFFQWQESGKKLEDFTPNNYSYLETWHEAAVQDDPSGVICGRCKADNTWFDSTGWYYWWPADATGKPDGLPPVPVCYTCWKELGLRTEDR